MQTLISFSNSCTIQVVTETLPSGEVRFHGLGAVTCGGIKLRDATLPMLPEIRTPTGEVVVGWRIIELRNEALQAEIIVEPLVQSGGPTEWMLHAIRNRYQVTDWSQGPVWDSGSRLVIHLRAASRQVAGIAAEGFSYRYVWTSDHLAIYRLFDRASWEPSGQAIGNTLWSRNACMPPEARVDTTAQSFSSEWYLPSIRNPEIFQFIPWQTGQQGFSFTLHERGILMTWATAPAHIRTLFEKPRGINRILHIHEHTADLSREFNTVPVEVLWLAGARDRVAAMNVYEEIHELVAGELHRVTGIQRERIATYGVVESWLLPDFPTYTTAAVPALLRMGCKWIYVPSQFENNMNHWGMSNMCCTVDLKVAENVDPVAFQRFCQSATAGGARVEMWGNTAYSALDYLLPRGRDCPPRAGQLPHWPKAGSVQEVIDAEPEFWLRNAAGAIEADHYHNEFVCTNLRSPAVTGYWHGSWKKLKTDIGVSGIFLDSSFNLSSDKHHWVGEVAGQGGATMDQSHLLGRVRPPPEEHPARAILTQYHAYLELIRTMQANGYRWSGEDLGVFGVRRAGPSIAARLSNLHLWADSYAVFDVEAIRAANEDPEDIFFRALAYRSMWYLYWDCNRGELTWNHAGIRGPSDHPTAPQSALYHAFNDVIEHMDRRQVLPDEKGILWSSGTHRVLWSCQPLSLPFTSATVIHDVLAGASNTTSELHAGSRRVYTWKE